MFPPNQQKLPRPRSSLSTDESSRFKVRRKKHPTNAVTLTLVGCCLFLFVLCFFLLGALVVVGRSLVKDDERINSNLSTITSSLFFYGDNNKHSINLNNPNLRSICNELNYKQKVTFRPSEISRGLSNLSDNNKELSTLPGTDSISNKRNSSSATVLSNEIMQTSKILNKLSFRLPKEIRPKHYQLFLKPDLKAKTFSGNITIRLEVLSPIAFVPVHSKRLTVSTRKFNKIENDNELHNINPLLTYEYPDLEYWVTEFEKNLEIGEYSMQLDFNGSLIDRIVGFYQSSYIDKKTNESRSIATSKFEPTYARQAFPCFDEPDKKAKFQITVVHPSYDNYTALSNMNVESTKKDDEYHTAVTFAESVPMSTYLVCFIVSDFQSKSREIQTGGIGNNFDLRVFSTPAQLDKVQHALDTGAAITEYYIQYFKIQYPLPKLDMAAIPDFVSGAMEHWGLVTFRETTLLFDSETSSSANKQRVAEVVAHELAHMWFGNLVTMKWWNDLWLNEGFASYIEYKGVDKVFPEWKMLDQFITNDMHGVLKLDATLASHPIVQKVESPDQITELFDSITYSKGASIIRMLEHFVSPEKFQEGVSNFLSTHAFGNANTEDLLTEIENLGFPFDVTLIMKTWTEQMGFPVVQVQKLSNTEYKLTQKRFFANPEDYNGTYDDSPFNYHWSIPITSFTSDNPNAELRWFNYNDAEVTITLPTAAKWIKLNKDQVGYYRVNYPEDMWQSLTQALMETPEVFSISDRAHLINDVFALADATQVPYNIALDITRYLEKEVDFVPWSVAASKLISLKNLLRYTDTYKSYSKHVRKLVDKAYKEVTWTVGTDHLQNSLRVKILNAACSLGHEDCMQEVSHKFNQWQSNLDVKPSPDIRTTVYYYGMMVAGTESSWENVWDLFKNEQDASEKLKLMQGLAGIREPFILSRFIDLSWDENNVRGQDYFNCLINIAANPVGEGLVWDYVRENWEKLVDRFGLNDRYLGSLIRSITSHFTTELKLEEMNIFFKKYPEAGAGTAARKQALETVKSNIIWLAENKQKISMWLSNNQS